MGQPFVGQLLGDDLDQSLGVTDDARPAIATEGVLFTTTSMPAASAWASSGPKCHLGWQ